MAGDARLARALYRLRQGVHALRPRLDEDRLADARDLLNEAGARLFFAMEKRDQRHALEVADRLRAMGVEERDVLIAALLHDCGKGAIPVWLRVLRVLDPAFIDRVADSRANGWRGAAYRLAYHAEIGASLAEEAGASPLSAGLIAGRTAAGDEAKLTLLRAADDAS